MTDSQASRNLPRLPIDASLAEIVAVMERDSALVLQASPGAGKTTRVPSALLDSRLGGEGKEILVLEPRRLAAKMAARRVAEERGERVGETVGYQFRFENVSGPKTRLRFLTEGMLMRRLLGDPGLKNVAAVILDEFHERHLHGDVALAFLRKLQLGNRPDLRILVMSATLDTEALSAYLGGCKTIRVEGRNFPVETSFLSQPPAARGLELAVRDGVERMIEREDDDSGDLLVFLPGMAEIRRAEDALGELARSKKLLVLPLHGELSREEQDQAVSRADRRKVILSTNVAETSLTIEGVTTVVDAGLARVASFSWWSGLPALRTRPISKASAIQRAGRAGRTAPGRCLRLYTKNDFDGRAPFDVPEIARADLAQTVLELKALAIGELAAFPWFEAPSPAALEAAGALLYRLGALSSADVLSSECRLTEIGKILVEMPAHPRIGRLILEASRRGLGESGAVLGALLSEGRLERGDWIPQIDRARRDASVQRVADRLAQSLRRTKPDSGGASTTPRSSDAQDRELRYAALCGFPDRVAKLRQKTLVLSSGGSAQSESDEPSGQEYFVTLDAEEKKHLHQQRSQVVARLYAPIEVEWLLDLEPAQVRETDEILWDAERGRIEAISRMTYGQLVLSESRGAPVAASARQAARVMVDGIWKKPEWLNALIDPEALALVRARLDFISGALREGQLKAPKEGFALPDLGDTALKEKLAEYAEGKNSVRDLGEINVLEWMQSEWPAEVREFLDRMAPTHAQLLRGRRVKIHYEPGKPPWIESRLQDFFGMTQGPAVLGGKLALTLHLLAPNQRAVQVTSDLAGFWKRIYPDLRRELGRRYPRHSWPEDPLA